MTGRQEYDRTKDRQRILGKYMIDVVCLLCSGLPVAIPAALLLLRDPAVRAVLLAGSIPGIRAHRHVAHIPHLSGMYIHLKGTQA